MSKPKIQNLKGFRDFLPTQKRERDFVMAKITEVFQKFGFAPLETPTLEYASLLLGKYGDEADKLVYSFADRGDRKVALRYDQTVPTARVLAQYQNELPRYFRRYQIQNVFRADKPQKGRFREFTQCDIDIFGAKPGLADAEILACTYEVYRNIGFENIEIKINDRQTLLSTLSPFATDEVDVFSIIQSIDKLDKQTPEKVAQELIAKGLDTKSAQQALTQIDQAQISPQLQEIVEQAENLGVDRTALVFDPKLARGLDYYTGMIVEIIIPEYTVGSVGGGGRYDQLIQQLGSVDVSAVGIAVGFDRTLEAALELNLIPTDQNNTQVLVTIFDEKLTTNSLQIAQKLRQAGVSTEVYPICDKLGKQFKLADQKGIPFVVIIGQNEADQNQLTLKNMRTGEQQTLNFEETLKILKK